MDRSITVQRRKIRVSRFRGLAVEKEQMIPTRLEANPSLKVVEGQPGNTAARDPWLAALEHEIRGTLQTFSFTLSRVLETTNALAADKRELMKRSLVLLSRTIDDFVDAVSVGAGKIPYRPARIQISQFVRALVEVVSQVEPQHSFTWSSMPELEASADPVRLQQIVTNLLTNAVKYSAPGSLELGAQTEPERVVVWLKDEGPGISGQDQELLFQPYSRLGSRQEGSGLGLWIARELARGMGGDLWLRSASGENTIFYLALPR